MSDCPTRLGPHRRCRPCVYRIAPRGNGSTAWGLTLLVDGLLCRGWALARPIAVVVPPAGTNDLKPVRMLTAARLASGLVNRHLCVTIRAWFCDGRHAFHLFDFSRGRHVIDCRVRAHRASSLSSSHYRTTRSCGFSRLFSHSVLLNVIPSHFSVRSSR